MDRKGYIYLNYSGDIDMKILLRRLHLLQFQYNIGVRQHSGSSYTIDLTKILSTMSILSNGNELEIFRLEHLGKYRLPKGSDWLDCIRDYSPPVDEIVGQRSYLKSSSHAQKKSRLTWII